MGYYYIFTVIICALSKIKRWQFFLITTVFCCLFLLLMPSTQVDYDSYMGSYNNAYFSNKFPWIQSGYGVDLDPLFSVYMAAFSLFTPLDYPGFLATNFLLCLIIFNYSCSILNIPGRVRKLLILFTLSSVFITVFYWSPRSSISYYLMLLGVAFMSKGKHKQGVGLFAMTCLLHSQFILQAVIILIASFVLSKKNLTRRKRNGLIALMIVSLSGLIFAIPRILPFITNILSSFSLTQFAASKANIYLTSVSNIGLPRITAILSIIVLPLVAYLFYRDQHSATISQDGPGSIEYKRLSSLLLISTISGMIINLAFLSDATVAGRLSRFSDYTGFVVLLPIFIYSRYGRRACAWCALFFCLIAPFIYRTQYPEYLLFP